MLINLSEIMSVHGRVEHIEAPIELRSFQLNGIEYEFASKGLLALTVTNLGGRRVLIEASGTCALNIPCNRCLENVVTDFSINMSKEIDFNNTESMRLEQLDETNYIIGYNLDVDMLIYDEILVDFPMKVLCDENCKGICNVCGRNLNNGTCTCESTASDLRMSVIRDIFNNSK